MIMGTYLCKRDFDVINIHIYKGKWEQRSLSWKKELHKEVLKDSWKDGIEK